MVIHNMLADKIDGSEASCESFATKVTRGCQLDKIPLERGSGTISFDNAPIEATYGRLSDEYCPIIPAQTEFSDASVEGDGCGYIGNVNDIVSDMCTNHASCDIEVTDQFFGLS